MNKFHALVTAGTRRSAFILVLSAGLVAAACGDQIGRNLTGPSATGGTQAKPPVTQADATLGTVVTFQDFDAATLTVTVKTTTTSDDPVDGGKIQLQILVDGAGQPVPCGSEGTWVRFDQVGGGIDVVGGMTTHSVDLDDLSSRGVGVQDAACGDSICIRAHYVPPSGPGPKAAQHQSDPTPFDIPCPACTYTQGFWKTHGPVPTGQNQNEWPADVMTFGLMLGDVNYTAAQLQAIFDTQPGGQGGSNGLISLAHQLIAAKLNVANGADDTAVAAAIAAADTLIGSLVVPPVGSGYLDTSVTSGLTTTLASYNEGLIGPGHCGDEVLLP